MSKIQIILLILVLSFALFSEKVSMGQAPGEIQGKMQQIDDGTEDETFHQREVICGCRVSILVSCGPDSPESDEYLLNVVGTAGNDDCGDQIEITGSVSTNISCIDSSVLQVPIGFCQLPYGFSSLVINVDGQGGNDRINAQGVPREEKYHVYLSGGAGNDKIKGGPSDEFIYGGGGHDDIWGFGGNDHLYGEDGNDRIDAGAGDDIVEGGRGNDHIFGDPINPNYVAGSAINPAYGTTPGDDTIYGGPGTDYIHGMAGIDVIHGGANNDHIRATHGLMKGDGGDDRIAVSSKTLGIEAWWSGYGCGEGDELPTLMGGAGNDRLLDSDCADTLMGGPGNDYLCGAMSGGGTVDYLNGEGGADVILYWGVDDEVDSDSADTVMNFEDCVDRSYCSTSYFSPSSGNPPVW